MNPSLVQALRVNESSRVAFAGAGGKTTTLFQLARSLPSPVIVTATSHLGVWQVGMADRHIITSSPGPLEELESSAQGVILITGELDEDRTRPVDEKLLDWLNEFCGYQSIPLLIEADGSRQKPLKAWAEHEPAIPSFVNQVVQVVGLSALGRPLTSEYVHRPEIFSRLSGLAIGESITVDSIARLLSHPAGGLKNMPGEARRVIVLNQADTPGLQSIAHRMAQSLLAAYESVVISSLRDERIYAVHEPVAGILLAAGASTRYGKVKQLLDWRGEPFVRAVARTALEAGCSPVVVVTGANADQIGTVVEDLEVHVVHNPDWEEGQASSIRRGIQAIDPSPAPREFSHTPSQEVSAEKGKKLMGGFRGSQKKAGAAIFLLADQPQVTTSILHALMERHAEGLYPVVAPLVMDRRANPVLFDRSTFHDLLSLQGDIGGRAIFHKHRVEYLPWHDDRLLLDVDTPEMYQRLNSDETL